MNYNKSAMAMHNFEIIKKDNAHNIEEGRLSLICGPHPCKRYKSIKVKYQNMEILIRIKTYTGWIAHIIKHKVDYCDGMLIQCPKHK